MSFSQALSGLAAQSENIKIITNNIANSQTVGFKSSGAAFADIYAGANSRVGLGVQVAAVMQDFDSGDLENTGRNLDLAIAGQGFYRLEQPNGEVVYSRNGQFNVDASGYVVNQTGQFLTGYGLSDPTNAFSEVLAGGAPQRLRIPNDDMPPNETADVTATYNLDASVKPGQGLQQADVITVPADPTAGTPATTVPVDFHFSSSYTVFDSLGNERTVTTYFEKTAENTWDAVVALDGVNPDAATATFTLSFTSDGLLDVTGTAITATNAPGGAPADGSLAEGQVGLTFPAGTPPTTPYLLDGAEELNFDLDLADTTQFNNNSVQNSLEQDGYTSGSLIGLEVQEDGRVFRIYTNEERREAGQVVLANFANPEGLQPDGNNAWRQTNTSGEPVLGAGGTGTFGTIESGTLENSNVNLAEQLVDLIVAQRAYQANSSSISTQDELLQTVIQL